MGAKLALKSNYTSVSLHRRRTGFLSIFETLLQGNMERENFGTQRWHMAFLESIGFCGWNERSLVGGSTALLHCQKIGHAFDL